MDETGIPPYAISLLWPVDNISEGEMVTRNYLPQVALDDPIRPLRMLAFRKDCPGHPFVSEGSEGGGGESGDSCSNDESIRAIINTLLLSSPTLKEC